jgi:hypothetical protein
LTSLFTIILSVGLFVAYMTIFPPYLSGTDKLLNSGTIDSKGDQSIDSGRRYQQLLGDSVFDSNQIVQTNTNNTYSQSTFIFDNQSGSG